MQNSFRDTPTTVGWTIDRPVLCGDRHESRYNPAGKNSKSDNGLVASFRRESEPDKALLRGDAFGFCGTMLGNSGVDWWCPEGEDWVRVSETAIV